ncbi:Sec-independent protein translocase protein TatB [Histidinibacterium aquaticum]|uniref:Sec-independent protein translocase protein TatB n=1 Tax=Histidinibacterium aquaticum TaxID=2613962 RepID=A0A5J5GP94_9RHOB|nr:Sec-independent protein translocase protein TatB [Histidinibacterium aquaticum]KAA9009875.1 twin-arginine translocase subunit TatB [Histidinibacterium aquaticum]
MFGLGWTELLVVGIVALIVVGPEDLPQMFRTIGRFTGKARAMAREFSKAMNDAADQSGVNEINKTIRAASNPAKFGTDSIRKATGLGPETQKLSEERAEYKRKISDAAARKAEERQAREAEEAAMAAEAEDDELDAAMAESAGARPAATEESVPPEAPDAERTEDEGNRT